MRIVCPKCQSTYDVKADAIGAVGRMVKCADCSHKWFQEPVEEEEFAPVAKEEPEIAAGGDPWEDVAGDKIAGDKERGFQEAALSEDLETPAGPRLIDKPSRGKAPRKKGLSVPGLGLPQLGLGALAAVIALAIVFRTPLVRMEPSLAGLYAKIGLPVNVRGLALEGLATRLENDNGRRALVISGSIRNLTRSDQPVPPLRLAILDSKGREIAILATAPPEPVLAGGKTVPFSTRLAVPATGGESFELRFAAAETGLNQGSH